MCILNIHCMDSTFYISDVILWVSCSYYGYIKQIRVEMIQKTLLKKKFIFGRQCALTNRQTDRQTPHTTIVKLTILRK